MTSTCTPHPIAPRARYTQGLLRLFHLLFRMSAPSETASSVNQRGVSKDGHWEAALKSLAGMEESTLKDIGAPPWVISEIERNRQSDIRRATGIPHV